MRRAWPYVLLLVLAVVHVSTMGRLSRENTARTMAESPLYVLPSPILKIAALDHDGLVSDFLFIEGMAYLGGNFQYEGARLKIPLTDPQWKWFNGVMDASSDLDPYFQDPYYIVNSFLTWEAGMVREANSLLEKGSRYRDWDWTLPFFIGFNYFYFLQENEKAADYLMEASRRPEASPTLASLASRLAFKANRTETSVSFLEEMIGKTGDEATKKLFETRLETFRAVLSLEKAVDAYRRKFKRAPASPEDLVKGGVIGELPKDPYGGNFFIDRKGNVRTTSEKLLMPYLRDK